MDDKFVVFGGVTAYQLEMHRQQLLREGIKTQVLRLDLDTMNDLVIDGVEHCPFYGMEEKPLDGQKRLEFRDIFCELTGVDPQDICAVLFNLEDLNALGVNDFSLVFEYHPELFPNMVWVKAIDQLGLCYERTDSGVYTHETV